MALAYLGRASKSVLRKTGEDALLRGAPAGKVTVMRDVELNAGLLNNADDNFVNRYDIAAIDVDFDPKVGDRLEHPDGTFRLDRLTEDNGFIRYFIVVKVP